MLRVGCCILHVELHIGCRMLEAAYCVLHYMLGVELHVGCLNDTLGAELHVGC